MSTSEGRVLCVDLDGTLVTTDLLWESVLSVSRSRPWDLLLIPFWLAKGRAHLKRRLAERAEIAFESLPYRAEVVSFIAAARRSGRRVVLATASDDLLASQVALHLGFFDEIMASDGVNNLKGRTKARALVERFGLGNFDYIGDSNADVPCWAAAGDAFTVSVNIEPGVAHLRRLPTLEEVPDSPMLNRPATLLAMLRPHQWIKNLLLFVPAVAGHRIDPQTMVSLGLAFASLSLVASGGYVLNDAIDMHADRMHPRKKNRPIASGRIPRAAAIAIALACWAVGFGLAALTLPSAFMLILAIYLGGTVAYSLRLKREPVLDVMFLAGLYVLRIIAGGAATTIPVSTWLLTFTLFVCLSLALMKRFIEVSAMGAGIAGEVPGRGYQGNDAAWIQAAGLASAYLSVVILAIYVNSDAVTLLYGHPSRLLMMCPVLLYWATRAWLHAHRRTIHDDPVVAVVADPVTYVLLALSAAIVLAAS